VGGALLDTLAAGLGPAFTPAHRAAWAAMYQRISDVMQAAAAQVPMGAQAA
jgi:hemoglobin-like flavoprotein